MVLVLVFLKSFAKLYRCKCMRKKGRANLFSAVLAIYQKNFLLILK